jgi:acyl carrier protein
MTAELSSGTKGEPRLDAGLVKRRIYDYIVSTWLSGDGRGLDDDTDLQQLGVLDSFSTVSLMAFLDESFEIQLEPTEVNADSLRNINAITVLVMQKRNQSGNKHT